MIVAAHPAASFSESAPLLSEIADAPVTCVDVSLRTSFDAMIDDLEDARRAAGIERWVFWGMSGGGWLAQLYAHRHPEALAGIVIESACVCFRQRLADPTCAISPFFPAWRAALEERGLFAQGSHDDPTARDTEWVDVAGVGQVMRRRGGPALVVSPAPIDDVMKRQMPLLWTFDARPWIANVRVPALVVGGDADPVVPVARVRAVHEAIAGSSFIVVDGGSHVPSTAKPPVLVDAIRSFARAC